MGRDMEQNATSVSVEKDTSNELEEEEDNNNHQTANAIVVEDGQQKQEIVGGVIKIIDNLNNVQPAEHVESPKEESSFRAAMKRFSSPASGALGASTFQKTAPVLPPDQSPRTLANEKIQNSISSDANGGETADSGTSYGADHVKSPKEESSFQAAVKLFSSTVKPAASGASGGPTFQKTAPVPPDQSPRTLANEKIQNSISSDANGGETADSGTSYGADHTKSLKEQSSFKAAVKLFSSPVKPAASGALGSPTFQKTALVTPPDQSPHTLANEVIQNSISSDAANDDVTAASVKSPKEKESFKGTVKRFSSPVKPAAASGTLGSPTFQKSAPLPPDQSPHTFANDEVQNSVSSDANGDETAASGTTSYGADHVKSQKKESSFKAAVKRFSSPVKPASSEKSGPVPPDHSPRILRNNEIRNSISSDANGGETAGDDQKTNDPQTPVNTKKTQPTAPTSMKIEEPDDKIAEPDDSDEEDDFSQASSAGTSVRTTRFKVITVPVGPKFICGERLKKRKEYYTKLEEKHKALEAEKQEEAARIKAEEEAAIKELRKSMVVKANPVPSFYRDGPRSKAEPKKFPVTRAKSPNLSRRKSCGDAGGVRSLGKTTTPDEKGSACANEELHGFGFCRKLKKIGNNNTITSTKTKYVKNGGQNNVAAAREKREGHSAPNKQQPQRRQKNHNVRFVNEGEEILEACDEISNAEEQFADIRVIEQVSG